MAAFRPPEQTAIASDNRVLHAAVAAYLARYRGQSRLHTASDLKIFLTWCGTGRDMISAVRSAGTAVSGG
jgi:integrase/recombinase XerD